MLTIALVALQLAVSGQQQSRVVCYDEEDGLPQAHVTQMLQDSLGFMWFATWNGLCRYDGYEFRTFKPVAGDGCNMATDRFRDICLLPDGQILCRVDDDYCLFSLRDCRFHNLSEQERLRAADDIRRYRMVKAVLLDGNKPAFCYTDRQGNSWQVGSGSGVRKEIPLSSNCERLDIQPQAEVKCLFTDSQHRYWVATKQDKAVRVYSGSDDTLLGYLGSDGRLHQQYTRFGAAIYSMYQQADGTLWLGTKPDGLFRLRETSACVFSIDHITQLPNTNVYNILADGHGRLWVATLGGGLCYTDVPQAAEPQFRVPKGYPSDVAQRVRYLHLTAHGDVLLAATTDGLLAARIESKADAMVFRHHHREADRAESLSSSATMDIMENGSGNILVSTESGGVNIVDGSSLLSGGPIFRHITAANHLLPGDVVLSLTAMDSQRLLVVSAPLVSIIDSTGSQRVLDARYWGSDFRFSDAHPQQLSGGRWLFGLQDGACVTSVGQMMQTAWQPRVVLTGISIQGGADTWAAAYTDTLLLQPSERSVTIHFAAIDYEAASRISYAFRISPDDQWNYIGHDRSATLLDLRPGTYVVEIRSTDADGLWLDNARRLTIVVRPTFWESLWGRLLILLLIVGTVSAVIYTILYIRRIKRHQRETLEKYLALIEQPATGTTAEGDDVPSRSESTGAQTATDDSAVGPSDSDQSASGSSTDVLDPMLRRVMQFVEENIGNSDAGIGDMAAAAAVSRSGLQRRLKQTMGITPQELLHRARIKHACQLLRQTDKNIAEVAYACGFSDPKYFSRSFKQSVGKSPTEYKSGQ